MAEEVSIIHDLTSFFDECIEYIPESVYLQPSEEYDQNKRFNFKVFCEAVTANAVEKWKCTKDSRDEGTVVEEEKREVRSRKGDNNGGEDRRAKQALRRGGGAGDCRYDAVTQNRA